MDKGISVAEPTNAMAPGGPPPKLEDLPIELLNLIACHAADEELKMLRAVGSRTLVKGVDDEFVSWDHQFPENYGLTT